jgi:signal transduction histidine kinase
MTKEHQENLIREEELAFFGAVTASISHDLNNAIAVIEQTAGLLEDLALEDSGDRTIDKGQVQQIAERIGKQTKRGATIIRRLNAFAHSVDDPKRELDLNDLIQNVATLARRMAERKRVQLEPHPGDRPIAIESSPFRLQQAAYLAVQNAVAASPEGERIRLSAGGQNGKAWIEVAGRTTDSPPELELSSLETLMGRLGGEIESTMDGGKILIRMILPS